jgi:hypothetical protein
MARLARQVPALFVPAKSVIKAEDLYPIVQLFAAGAKKELTVETPPASFQLIPTVIEPPGE